MNREPVSNSHGSFNEILPFRLPTGSHLDRGQREYGRSDDRERAVGSNSPTAFLFPCACPYHSRSVIARSGSGSPLNHKWRTLARATLGSFATRIPKALELSREVHKDGEVGLDKFFLPKPMPLQPSYGRSRRREALASLPAQLRSLGSVGVRATSKTRTYRRVEVEQGQNELRKNRGSKLKRPAEGKSCSVSESRKNSFSEQEELIFYKDSNRLCLKCKENEAFWSSDWCDECMWRLIQE